MNRIVSCKKRIVSFIKRIISFIKRIVLLKKYIESNRVFGVVVYFRVCIIIGRGNDIMNDFVYMFR